MNTTTRTSTAERLGRAFGRGWRAYARCERRAGAFVGGHLAHLQPEADVVGHREVREQRVVLEHHCDLALRRWQPRDIAPADGDAAAGGLLQPRDDAQRGRFAAARRAEEHAEAALVHLKVDALQRMRGTPLLANVLELDRCHGRDCVGLP